MKKNIILIFLLMVVSAAGVIVLQFYFTRKSYREEAASFERDVNAALYEATERSAEQKCAQVANQFRGWLEDTSFIGITADWNPAAQKTVFTLREKGLPTSHPDFFSLRITLDGYDEKEADKKPGARNALISHLSEQVNQSLRTGSVSFYTGRLGDSLQKYFFDASPDLQLLKREYTAALHRRTINLPFTFLGKNKPSGKFYVTRAVNSSSAPRTSSMIRAAFTDPAYHLMIQLKWMIISSIILIAITLFCFYYTIQTLLSQQRLAKLKNDFISNMGHELHTPLCSISITAEALRSFPHDAETQQSYLDIILHQSRKLTGLTDELITAAKLEQTKMPLQDAIDLNQLIGETAALFHPDQGVVIYVPAKESPQLKGNALHLSGAIGNLIDNAIKYNLSGRPEVKISCISSPKEILISVTDNGPGIPADEKGRIFAQFYRIPSANMEAVKGYGLGLSYVKKVVAAHGGTIEIQDVGDGGSTFILHLLR